MSYNQTSNVLSTTNKKTTFRNYMHTQVRYVKFVSHILEIDTLNCIEKYALRYKELYTTKHGIYINS